MVNQYRPCAGICVVNKTGKIFVGQRQDTVSPAWQMPQGGIEPGEDPIDAARRELIEETGIGPEAVQFVKEMSEWLSYDFPAGCVDKMGMKGYKGQRQKWFLFAYIGDDADIKLPDEEFSDWQWVSPHALIELAVPFKRRMYHAVCKKFFPMNN